MSHASRQDKDIIQLKPKVGISSCLLGNEVRYDGGHKHARYLIDTLGEYFEFVPYCPEVAIGLGTPRVPIRLVNHASDIRAVNSDNPEIDVSEALSTYAESVLAGLHSLSGFIVKKGSPSCGMEQVQVFQNEIPSYAGRGIFTARLMQLLPELPVEEEGRLMDQCWRENFIARVFTYYRQSL